MKLNLTGSIAVVLFLSLTSCNTIPKTTEAPVRQPQSSVYSEIELYATDAEAQDAMTNVGDDENATALEIFKKYCKKSVSQVIKKNDRVVTQLNGEYVAGNVVESFDNGTNFEVALDYGPTSTLRQAQTVKRSAQEISKSLSCVGTKSKVIYGLFKIDNKFYTGHVREVFENGVVRFVNDNFHEQFTTADQVTLEAHHSALKAKTALFTQKGSHKKGEIRRVFGKDTVLIKSGGELYLRNSSEVEISD